MDVQIQNGLTALGDPTRLAIFGMMRINKQPMATPAENAGPETRRLLQKWNYLHGIRTLLGFLSALAFLFGITSK